MSEYKEKKDMFNCAGKLNWLVVAVLLLVLIMNSSTWAADGDSSDKPVVGEQKMSIIPEPATLVVILAGFLLFAWKRKYKDKSRPIAP